MKPHITEVRAGQPFSAPSRANASCPASFPGSQRSSESRKAIQSALAARMPLLRAAAAPAFCWRSSRMRSLPARSAGRKEGIGRAVVDDDDFERHILLLQHRTQRRYGRVLPPVNGDDDGNIECHAGPSEAGFSCRDRRAGIWQRPLSSPRRPSQCACLRKGQRRPSSFQGQRPLGLGGHIVLEAPRTGE